MKDLEPLLPADQSSVFKVDYESPSSPYKRSIHFAKNKLKYRRSLEQSFSNAMSPKRKSGHSPHVPNQYRNLRIRPVSEHQHKRWASKTYTQPNKVIPDDIVIPRWPECKRHITGAVVWGNATQKLHTLGPLLDQLEGTAYTEDTMQQAEEAYVYINGITDDSNAIPVTEAEMIFIKKIRTKLLRAMATYYGEYGSTHSSLLKSTMLDNSRPGFNVGILEDEEAAIQALALQLTTSAHVQRFGYNVASDTSHDQAAAGPDQQEKTGPSQQESHHHLYQSDIPSPLAHQYGISYDDDQDMERQVVLPDTRLSPMHLVHHYKQQQQEKQQRKHEIVVKQLEAQFIETEADSQAPSPDAIDVLADVNSITVLPRNQQQALPAGEIERTPFSLSNETTVTTVSVLSTRLSKPNPFPKDFLAEIKAKKHHNQLHKTTTPTTPTPAIMFAIESAQERHDRLKLLIQNMEQLKIPQIALSLMQQHSLLGRGKFAAVYSTRFHDHIYSAPEDPVAFKSVFTFLGKTHQSTSGEVGMSMAMKLAQYKNTSEPPTCMVVDEFERELQALHALQGHANIVNCRGYTLQPLGIVLELVTGQNMYDALCDPVWQEATSELIRWRLFADVINGLKYMHELRYIHRDIKVSLLHMPIHDL
jgi:hypothetical protein